ncbi:DUF3298 and DUF4163 domain-containing protein [Paenibacillus sp. FSL H8-0537]|uniref:DUF3298 and DUF4163 domain-containing protein n=1 Tax=Paenibacillus sp. FSL H8-0537 TaxID=2921399 RepID=UPI0031011E59
MAFQSPVIVQSVRSTSPKAELWLPHISGGSNEAADSQINGIIHSAAQHLIAEQGTLEDPHAEMQGYFELKNNQKDVLSLSLFNYAYTGGAHGLTLQQSLTFKLTTGRSYALAELFKPGSNYIVKLSALVTAQIRSRDISTLSPFKAIRPDQDFYIADRTLVLYFALYELTPYAFGFPYFPISVYDIEDMINENGPLGPMVVNY